MVYGSVVGRCKNQIWRPIGKTNRVSDRNIVG